MLEHEVEIYLLRAKKDSKEQGNWRQNTRSVKYHKISLTKATFT